jgi:hypothetical protein
MNDKHELHPAVFVALGAFWNPVVYALGRGSNQYKCYLGSPYAKSSQWSWRGLCGVVRPSDEILWVMETQPMRKVHSQCTINIPCNEWWTPPAH